jgi:hypothetical protein
MGEHHGPFTRPLMWTLFLDNTSISQLIPDRRPLGFRPILPKCQRNTRPAGTDSSGPDQSDGAAATQEIGSVAARRGKPAVLQAGLPATRLLGEVMAAINEVAGNDP